MLKDKHKEIKQNKTICVYCKKRIFRRIAFINKRPCCRLCFKLNKQTRIFNDGIASTLRAKRALEYLNGTLKISEHA